jgi:hypothetical protein
MGLPKQTSVRRLLFACRLKGTVNRPFQPCGKETIPNKFPQANTRLSKANLEICCFSVNLPQAFFVNCFSIFAEALKIKAIRPC